MDYRICSVDNGSITPTFQNIMILLLGATGYIGSVFVEELQKRGKYFGTDFLVLSRSSHYNYSFTRIVEIIGDIQPSLILNCAAYTGGNTIANCEKDRAQTIQANTLLPQTVVNAASLHDVPVMHISTGCLYQHGPREPYTEDDPPQLTIDAGANIYTSSKELAERVVREYPKHYIMRIRLPFDEIDHPRNLITKLIAYPETFDDTNSLSHRRDFVKACLDLFENNAPYGTYNLTNPGAISTVEISEYVEYYLKIKKDWKFTKVPVNPHRSNCILDTLKAYDAGIRMRNVHEAMIDSLMNWKQSGQSLLQSDPVKSNPCHPQVSSDQQCNCGTKPIDPQQCP